MSQPPNVESRVDDQEFARDVVLRLRKAGFEALWAGGCVRDLLMGNVPEDFDVATAATPQQVRQLFGHRNTLPVGASFGVIIVLSEAREAQPVEVATFRTEEGYSDGRRPDSVTFSTAEEDARRRDFTINGMFYDPVGEQVIDYVGGQEDLQRRVVRAIGLADARIGEDKLRMLRAIRFAARFAFQLEVETFEAIRRHSANIVVVSGERIAVEVQKTLQTQGACWAVQAWADAGLLPLILPEISQGWVDRGPAALELLDAAKQVERVGDDWRILLAALLWRSRDDRHFLEATLSLRQRLKLANEDCDAILFALTSQAQLENAEQKPWSIVQPSMVDVHFSTALGLLVARSRVGEVSATTLAWLGERSAWPSDKLDPPPLLDGRDLIGLGLSPSPKFKLLLAETRALQLDGQLTSREEALARVVECGR